MQCSLGRSIAVAITCLLLTVMHRPESVTAGFSITCLLVSELQRQYDPEEQPSDPKISVTDFVLSSVSKGIHFRVTKDRRGYRPGSPNVLNQAGES